jgi:hypothetical protein
MRRSRLRLTSDRHDHSLVPAAAAFALLALLSQGGCDVIPHRDTHCRDPILAGDHVLVSAETSTSRYPFPLAHYTVTYDQHHFLVTYPLAPREPGARPLDISEVREVPRSRIAKWSRAPFADMTYGSRWTEDGWLGGRVDVYGPRADGPVQEVRGLRDLRLSRFDEWHRGLPPVVVSRDGRYVAFLEGRERGYEPVTVLDVASMERRPAPLLARAADALRRSGGCGRFSDAALTQAQSYLVGWPDGSPVHLRDDPRPAIVYVEVATARVVAVPYRIAETESEEQAFEFLDVGEDEGGHLRLLYRRLARVADASFQYTYSVRDEHLNVLATLELPSTFEASWDPPRQRILFNRLDFNDRKRLRCKLWDYADGSVRDLVLDTDIPLKVFDRQRGK